MRIAIIAVVLAAAGPAFAQECHPLPGTNVPDPPPREAPSDLAAGAPIIGVRAGMAFEAAAIDDGLGRQGNYTGAISSVEVAALGARARVSLGAYHIDWGQRGSGLGDVQLALQRAVIAFGEMHLGAAISATLPTGDVRDELGMGHPMIMPAGWARWADGRSSLLVSIVYGSMLGGHHHGMVEPVVSPMNSEEVSAGVRAGRRFGQTELAATANGAIPIGPGLARGAVGGAAHWQLGDTELGLDISAPFGGTPIHARGVFEISRLF